MSERVSPCLAKGLSLDVCVTLTGELEVGHERE